MSEGREDQVKLFPGMLESPQDDDLQTPQASPSGSSGSSSGDSSSSDSQSTDSSQRDQEDEGHSPQASPPHAGREMPQLIPAEYEAAPLLPPPKQEEAEDVKKKNMRGQGEPGLINRQAEELPPQERPNLEANGREPNDNSAEVAEAMEETGHQLSIQCETVQDDYEHHLTAAPPEYHFKICKEDFSKDSNWKKTKNYKSGRIKFDTEVSFHSEVTPHNSQQRQSSVIIQLTVTPSSYNPNNVYEGKARVTLYDEKAGRILKPSEEEERKFDKGKNYVKFTVDIGAHQEIEKSRSKKLQLQVKVQVRESRTYRDYWEVLSKKSMV